MHFTTQPIRLLLSFGEFLLLEKALIMEKKEFFIELNGRGMLYVVVAMNKSSTYFPRKTLNSVAHVGEKVYFQTAAFAFA